MRRLKLSCPFGGKLYPISAACISVVVVPLLTMKIRGFPPRLLLWLTMLTPVAVLVGCYFFEQHLTAGERDIMEHTEYPLWMPAPPELIDAARDAKSTPSKLLYPIGMGVLGMILAVVFPEHGEPNMALACVGAVVFALVCGIDWYLRGEWKNVDETMVYTKIPIHHMYDVKRSDKRRTWYESYMVFYLPDGRYVLHAKKGSGITDSIFVMKYRNMVIWIPAFPLPQQPDESRINTLVP